MPNSSSDQPQLDGVFRALADPTRRAVVERLARGSAPTMELARRSSMALPSFVQHLDVLERCGFVTSHKSGRVRTYQLSPDPLRTAGDWLDRQRRQWDVRLDQLDTFLSNQKDMP